MKKFLRLVALTVTAVLVTLALVGCFGGKSDNKESNVELTWYYSGDSSGPDNKEVFAKANEIIKGKLGFTVNFVPIDYANYEEKMKMIIAGGEEFDICWTSNWYNNYYQNVAKGAFIELDELLVKEAPELKASMPDKIWDGARVKGNIYGIINNQIMARSTGMFVPKELEEKYGFDIKTVKKMEDFEPLMAKTVTDNAKRNIVGDLWTDLSLYYGIEEILGDNTPGAIYYNKSGEIKVFNQYESSEWLAYIEMRKRWHDTNLSQSYLVNRTTAEDASLKKKSEVSIGSVGTYKPGVSEEKGAILNYPISSVQLSPAVLTSNGITSTLSSISVTSKHPVEAIRAISLMNTDNELYNLMTHGIEGKNYDLVEEKYIVKKETSTYGNPTWMLGNTFNSYLFVGQPLDVWEQTAKLNNEAFVSPILGFSANLENIKTEISSCKTAVEEFSSIIQQGIGDTATAQKDMVAKLKIAGVDKIIIELQTQIDTWLNEKK